MYEVSEAFHRQYADMYDKFVRIYFGICKNKKDEEMTVQQLKYILKVAEVGSITEAAKLLFISQPSLSNSIKETEKEAGITIFLRSRTGITLTKDGAEFLGYARQVIQQMELLEDRYVTNLPGYRTNGLCCRIYDLFSGFAGF